MRLPLYFSLFFKILFIILVQICCVIPATSSTISYHSHLNFLPVHQAFQFSGKVENGKAIVHAQLATGYYLYKERISFHATTQAAHVGSPAFPADMQEIMDPFQNKRMVILPESGDIVLPYATKDSPALLRINFQGCAKAGLCYPPSEVTIQLAYQGTNQPGDSEETANIASTIWNVSATHPHEQHVVANIASQEDNANHYFKLLAGEHSLLALLALFFLAGILLAFTPCVLPMIPILSATLAGSMNNRKRIILMTLVYILCMALTYAITGVLVGIFGNALHLQDWFQTPWVIGLFAAVFVILAGSMFGFYNLQLPEKLRSIITSADAASTKKRGGSLAGAGVMGVCSALIVSPCITAPLVGALIYISSTQDGWLGGLVLFSLGLGMGVPLFAVGAGLGQYLPKSGVWMNKVKYLFGILMLGIALWLICRLLPEYKTLMLWGIFISAISIYLLLSINWQSKTKQAGKLITGIPGILLLIYGVSLIVGGLMGNTSFVRPLALPEKYAVYSEKEAHFIRITLPEELNNIRQQAIKNHKLMLVDFAADWCEVCQALEKDVFADPDITALLSQLTAVRFDLTKTTAVQRKLMDKMHVFGTPTLILYAEDGTEVWRHSGIISREAFKSVLTNKLKNKSNGIQNN